MKLIETLKNIGFTENEAKIYLTLLETGKNTAYKLANQAGFKKTTTYGVLNSLSRKNIVVKIPTINTTFYKVKKPQEIFNSAKNKVKEAQKMLPLFDEISDKNHFSSNVYYFDGLEEIKKMYDNMLDNLGNQNNQEILNFGSQMKNSPKELLDFWEKFNRKRIKRKIKARSINSKEKNNKWIKNPNKYLFNYKLFDKKEYDTNINVEIFNGFVQIVSPRYLQGILIDNPDIYKTFKQIFEMIWKRM